MEELQVLEVMIDALAISNIALMFLIIAIVVIAFWLTNKFNRKRWIVMANKCECLKCKWKGKPKELKNKRWCPECGSDLISEGK